MPVFTGRHTSSHTLHTPIADAVARFADLDRQIAAHPELASADKVDASTLRVRMKEMNHGPVAFAGHYTLVFTRTENAVRWRTTEGNVDVSGEAVFTPVGGQTRLAYTESVRLDLPVNTILGKVLRPIVEAMMAKGMKGFIERMVTSIG